MRPACLVHLARRGGPGDGTGDGQAVGDAAHEVGVADAGERAGARGNGGGVGVGDERRVPQLDGVDALRFVAVRTPHDERTVFEERPAVAGQRGRDLLADHVVRQQQAAALHARVEGEEHVLAVGRADRALELQALGDDRVEGLVRARGQVVAAGEDDALVIGQPAARLSDAVEADDRPGEGVERQVAVGVLLAYAATEGGQVAIGRPHPGAGGVVHSYEEALNALDLADRLEIQEPVLRVADLLVYPVLTRDRQAMADLVGNTLGPLLSARGGARPLVETLTAYFDSGCVAAEAARRLNLSVRAFTYRLERIHKLTGADPGDPVHRYTLQTAVIGARLLGWPDDEA
ncbi:PucR family transcriptional regulator [Streptomyces sp. NBC_01235]|uniref:PucR family transcriptional regulator n=1 Tax=Streptomyces sp. NBC_01235 TaxID=2903788 RepID=UPI002E0DD254